MENQNEQSKAVTMQIRADERTKEQFADFCKTLGVTQGAAMQQLLHVYELDAAKRMKELAGSADVIDDVRSHMDAVINAFLVQLEHNVNTNERFKQEYAERMESKEKALIDSQRQAQQARETAEQAQAALDAVKAQAEQEQQQAIAQVADANDRADRAEQARQALEQAAANAQRTADAMTARVEELTAERDRLRQTAGQVDSMTEELKQAQAEIARLETDSKIAAANAETDKAKAVAETETKWRDKLDSVKETLSETKDELSKTKTNLATITAERDSLKSRLEQLEKKA